MEIEYKQFIDLSNVNDSMELNSSTTIARLTGKRLDGTSFGAYLQVQGHVTVIYKDKLYSHASEMPEELLKLFHDGGYSPSDENLTVNENNWFELFIEENGQTVFSDVVDAEGLDETEVFTYLVDAYREYYENYYAKKS